MNFLKKILWAFGKILSALLFLLFLIFSLVAYSSNGFGAGFIITAIFAVFFLYFLIFSSIRYRKLTYSPNAALSQNTSNSITAKVMGTDYREAEFSLFMQKNRLRRVLLKRDPSNENDSNAIEVLNADNSQLIGFIDRGSAAAIASNGAQIIGWGLADVRKDEITLQIQLDRKLSFPESSDTIEVVKMPLLPDLNGVTFGDDAPTLKQFIYAYRIGADLRRDMTFQSTSKAIDAAKAKNLPRRSR